MTDLVVGLDASTTACKAIAFDRDGRAVAEGRRSIALSNPEPDAWEQNAEEWTLATEGALADLARVLGANVKNVRGIAIANQRETFVLTDDTGRPLRPALVWMDARGREIVAREAGALGAQKLHELTGKPPCITPSFYKAAALFAREPALAAALPRFLDVHGYLVWRLTGAFATSIAAADPLGLVDMRARDWSDELVGRLGLSRPRLPRLVAPADLIGNLSADVAQRVGFPAATPVFGGAGDGQAAGLGAGITAPGRAYLNLGTAIVSGVLANDYRLDRAFRTLFAATPGAYFLETDLKGGTFTVTWFVDKWLRRGRSDVSEQQILGELETEARAIAIGAEGLLLVPYWNGVMNPYWDDDATGIVVGFRGEHGPAHFYRALIEGIALEHRLHMTGVENSLGAPITELVVMGGGARSDLFCQTLADVLRRPIVRSETPEATALGAAMLAAIGCKMHPSADAAARAMTRTGARFTPNEPAAAKYDALFAVHRELYPALRSSLSQLRSL